MTATRTLVIDTATAACSVALIEHGQIIAEDAATVGRGHAERLLPMIAALPDGGRAGAVLVDCGPGSFTGIRVGLAAARALGLGWGASVHGYSSLALLAASFFAQAPDEQAIAAVLEGGHGEVFMQHFTARPFAAVGGILSLPPAAALAQLGGGAVGSGVKWLRPIAPDLAGKEALPVARDALLLPPDLLALAAQPIYGRPPDAKPMPQP
ncbi:tRNA (adenosine(37)-N6)-threonylcarbamoyltransferase complex dimerization subunit type 1 TsaB [Sphingomonas sp.]|uniref:tRNA (adenosine(37)-N6)-threonylcarbamoyltransferase complex dimerization subunit type 1 TsaB n=1 Tax=Sphingomonas sp. TaxID=28214 RepID=UPI001DDD520C|nr:tRNA (adenosine(37)-N6)-threonylcarbamoyltransferase complex dimerization subunit type 1 TsaB [Sphingomonas sp.]MBX9796047.1 tRNA (adenosine(37)-N6)-threonylcarbamoyltransferase complex dimerization subunit type 1 TsaB [Sphingomonas sp.]